MRFVQSVNVGVPRPAATGPGTTGIDKRPVDHPVAVRAPGPRKGDGSGLAGDAVCDGRHHGGDEQAVYAFAREDLDEWERELGLPLKGGVFGENLTTVGVDVTGALLGERWRVGRDVVLEVTCPRIPCGTFARWMGVPGWVRRFTRSGAPGAYLRVLAPGEVTAGDGIVIDERPDHGITIGLAFRALTTDHHLLPSLLVAGDHLVPELRARAERREGFELSAT